VILEELSLPYHDVAHCFCRDRALLHAN